MRYVIYTRVSTKKQTVENQLLECKQYVYKMMKKGDELIEFCEPDKSTTLPMSRRKKLIEMMESLQSGDHLVVYKVDRLARDKQELINIYCDIRKKGVEIHGLYDPGLNEESICIYAFMACSERKNIQIRTKSGLARKQANGERVGATWYGYKLDTEKLQMTKEDAHSYKKPYLLLKDEYESRQVALMMDYHKQGMSYGDIVKSLDQQGYKNRNGHPIGKSSVFRILRRLKTHNPALAEISSP